MNKLIRTILREQSEDDTSILTDELKSKVWFMFDKLGIEKSLVHIDFGMNELLDIIVGYYNDYDTPKHNPSFDVTFNRSEISELFSRYDDVNVESIVSDYLGEGLERYDYECFDYDHSWMWDDINAENQKIITDSATKNSIVDEDIEDFIIDEFGSDIGCVFSDAQNDADSNAIGSDIDIAIEDFFIEIDGEWVWVKQEFVGRVSVTELSKSEEFAEAVEYELQGGTDLSWDNVLSQVMDYEIENAGYDSVLFTEKMYFDTDKHFRYGGAGDMDIKYMNELLFDRLENNY